KGDFIIYSITVEAEKDDREIKRMRAIEDRWTGWRNSSYLMQFFMDGGSRRLTAGKVAVNNWKISPDGTKLLFFREFPNPNARPYSRSELWEMELENLSTILILEDPWIEDAAYGPDNDMLALTGSPSAFNGLGRNLPENITPNDYGGQVYLFNRLTNEAQSVSKNFDPSIGNVTWHSSGLVCATALDGQYKRLAVYVPGSVWQLLDNSIEVVNNTSFAQSASVALLAGTSTTEPKKLVAVNLETLETTTLATPGNSKFADISFGEVEPFTPTLSNGEKLDGRVYYPVNYDPSKKYPVIVYYYGGTSPITRDFGGRYPKNTWAAEGYFVYVPIPSGSLGYGQEFSARHVNDWGKMTAGEVIEGTKAFLKAYPAADADHMGCMGASYGGFLTMYLTTQTDMFTCSISHAGISSITGYWAEGYWGYSYGSRALAHNFPWNNPELYVNQSPLTHADQINTPLLLLHGTNDTNVPKGESDGMYTALKLLGKDVEYVRIDGQDHHILDYKKRIVWHNTIMSYFSKYLKDDDSWWEDMFKERG
ncbi:S9 family peptidase, partial [bacterium]|nr:S9 family peptidase [bacterium]